MNTVDVEGIVIDRCPTCGGIWFDLGELREILENKTLDTKPLIKEDKARAHVDVHTRKTVCCPRDGFAMMEIHDPAQKHIAYELCMMCGGIFLDSGELKDLSKVTLIERLRKALSK
jgi:Zn-finger nucleic acid-binding protein